MLMRLLRNESAFGWTLGRLFIDGQFECFTCEDVVRPLGQKIAGQTAIPAGTYRVVINVSPRFSAIAKREVRLPLLLDVPNFEGIRIHVGNRAEHTDGCILPGLGYDEQGVRQSQQAFDRLMAKLELAQANADPIWIVIAQAAGDRPAAHAEQTAAAMTAAPPAGAAGTGGVAQPPSPPQRPSRAESFPPMPEQGQG